jgi:hypothetical protein
MERGGRTIGIVRIGLSNTLVRDALGGTLRASLWFAALALAISIALDTRVGAGWVAQTEWPFRQKTAHSPPISAVLPVLRSFDAAGWRGLQNWAIGSTHCWLPSFYGLRGGGGAPSAWHIAYGKPRPRGRPGLPNGTSAAGSVADVHRPPAEAERRQHAAGHVAAVIAAATDEADAEAMAMTPVVMMMVRPDEAATRRSGGRRQRHGAEGSGGNSGESQFAKHGLSP